MNESMIFHDVYERIRKKRAIWFEPNDACLKEIHDLVSNSSKDIITEWSFRQVKRIIDDIKQKYPEETRPLIAYNLSTQWLHKEIKLPQAKQAILACHAAAKDVSSQSDQALFHAVGQGLSTIHLKMHAMGIPIYELTSIARDHPNGFEPYINQKIKEYLEAFYSFYE